MSDELWITHQRVNKPVSVIPRNAAPARGTPHPYPRPTASLVKGRWHGEAVTEGFRPPESYPKNGIPQSASLTAPFNKGAKGRELRIATSGRCPSSQ